MVSKNQGRSWNKIEAPGGYWQSELITLENGDYVVTSTNDSKIYQSSNGSVWNELVDVIEATDYQSSEVQALVAEGSTVYAIVKTNKILEIKNGTVRVMEFSADQWSPFLNMSYFEAELTNDHIVLLNKGESEVSVINLSTKKVTQYAVPSDSRIQKSNNEIYITSSSNRYLHLKNGVLEQESIDLPEYIYSYSNIVFFKGSPVFMDSNGYIHQFFN